MLFSADGGTTASFSIGSNGNVGIGTTIPDSKLTVAGKIHSQEVKVTATAGADFVFHKDYSLPGLTEVEKYVREKQHLPGIAPAKEMVANGIELGEMNVKLLQKIEELTLYLIEQKKEIGDLSKVKRIVRVTGYVRATDDFQNHPQVMNACSDLLVAVFGDKGRHARAALGMSSLPLGAAVEIDLVAEIE